MKMLLTATMITLFAAGTAMAQCHSTCKTGYTYNSETGACEQKSVSS